MLKIAFITLILSVSSGWAASPPICAALNHILGDGLGTNRLLPEFTVNFAELPDSPKASGSIKIKDQEAKRNVTERLNGVAFVDEDVFVAPTSTFQALDGTQIDVSDAFPVSGYPVWVGQDRFKSAQTLLISTGSGQACHYTSITPGSGEIRVGDVNLSIAEPDNPVKPNAWEGPITITQGGRTPCKTSPDVSLIQLPMYLDGRHLILSTYSGSSSQVQVVDVATCHVVWSRPMEGANPLSGGHLLLDSAGILHMGNKQKRLGANCLP